MGEVEVKCAHGGAVVTSFIESAPETVKYCSPKCSERASQRHGPQLDRWLAVLEQWDIICDAKAMVRCPATGKVRHMSEDHGWVLIAHLHPSVISMNPYPCDDCEAWHIGNSKSATRRRHDIVMRQIGDAMEHMPPDRRFVVNDQPPRDQGLDDPRAS